MRPLVVFRIAYYVLLAASTVASYFGLSFLPSNWKAAEAMMDRTDTWLSVHAAHPMLFAIAIGLLFGTIIIPEGWRIFKVYAFPPEARPDWDFRDAIGYLIVKSQWAIGRAYYIDGRLLEEDIYESLCDAVAQGRVSLWARPVPDGADFLFTRGTEIKLSPSNLDGMWLDLTTLDGDAPYGATLRAYSGDRFRFLRVNKRQVCSEWPPANRVRLWFDRTCKSRRKRIVEDDSETYEAV
jgi:hypothetical protein